MAQKILLFLCTGNYYRSRFAELLFNHQSSRSDLRWIAVSRGLGLELGGGNVGPISRATVEGLTERGITASKEYRYPLALERSDLTVASHIVALDGNEHLPLLKRKFPSWAERVEFWHVPDVDLARPSEALAQIDMNVRALIQRLSRRPAVISGHSDL
jgi:protein-tyrosine phosphatase